MSRLIDADAFVEAIKGVEVSWYLDGNYTTYDETTIMDIIKQQPTVEAVPKSYAEQIRWERDVAVGQLNEIGCQFGQKMDEVKKKLDNVPVVHCKECKNWHKDIGWCDKHSHFINSDGSFCRPWESNDWKMFNENDFCSDGERVKDECVCKKERH